MELSIDPKNRPILQTALCEIGLREAVTKILDSTSQMTDEKVIVNLCREPMLEDVFFLSIGQKSNGIKSDEIRKCVSELGKSSDDNDLDGMFFLLPFKICSIGGEYLIRSSSGDQMEFASLFSSYGMNSGTSVIEKVEKQIEFNQGMFIDIIFTANRPFSTGELHTIIMNASEEVNTQVRYTISEEERGDVIDRLV